MYTDRTDEVGSVICLWTLSLAKVWTWFFSTLACVSSGMSGDVWLIFRADSGTATATAKGGPGGSFIQPSSLYSLSSPSTCKGTNSQFWSVCYWNGKENGYLTEYSAECVSVSIFINKTDWLTSKVWLTLIAIINVLRLWLNMKLCYKSKLMVQVSCLGSVWKFKILFEIVLSERHV